MYSQFILIGDRLIQRYEIDRQITSVPEKPLRPARRTAPTSRREKR